MGSIMKWISRDKLRQHVLCGTFLNLGSANSVEIAAGLGFDWLLIDLEHGCGSSEALRSQLIAASTGEASSIVRIPSIDPDVVKFVMDSGAAGIMFPYVSSSEEAVQAVRTMKYPPQGSRGVAGNIRATQFGSNWKHYFETANANSLVVVQIETPEAVQSAGRIAAVDGVDVLFVGPLDLSVNMGCPGNFTDPDFVAALSHVLDACRHSGCVAGILSRPELVEQHISMGFQFVALGSDIGAIQTGLKQNLNAMRAASGANGKE